MYKFRSLFEAKIAALLVERGIEFGYQTCAFGLGHGSSYTPDFSVRVIAPDADPKIKSSGCTQVLIEPHGHKYISAEFVEKMHAFMGSEHHKANYLIIVSDAGSSRFRKFLEPEGLKEEDIADEVWHTNIPTYFTYLKNYLNQDYVAYMKAYYEKYVKEMEKFAKQLDRLIAISPSTVNRSKKLDAMLQDFIKDKGDDDYYS